MILVGPSGCGKSTALRMIAGLEDITDGELRIGGEVVNDKAPKDRDIAMVFQNYALYPHMTRARQHGLRAQAREGRQGRDRPARSRRRRRSSTSTQHLDRKPANLSGGQRQRVAMGRAIVRDPAAFLMDEPLSNLDAKLRVQMRTEVSRIQQRLGTTTVYVTHDQTEAMTLGDRVAVMRAGVLQQVGTPMELYNNPENLFVAGFIGSPAMNFMPATRRGRHAEAADGRRAAAASGASGSSAPTASADRRHPARGLRGRRARGRRSATAARRSRRTIDVLESMGSELYAHFSRRADEAIESEELRELAEDAGAGEVPGAGEEGRSSRGSTPASKVSEGRRPSCGSTPRRCSSSTPTRRPEPSRGRALRSSP